MQTCNCDKVYYRMKSEAQAAALGIWDEDRIKMTPYRCPENNFLNHYILKKQDIEQGETYLFVGSDSPKRAHLAGKPFTVSSIEKVYRKVPYRHKKRSMKVTRFFNDDGVGARAEELETLPANEWVKCNLCSAYASISGIEKIKEDNDDIAVKCPNCNAGPEYLINYPANETQADRGHGFCPKCDYPLTSWGAASDGDGDIYDEIGCDRCEEVIRKEHASYCTCAECDPWGLKADAQDLEANKADSREFPCSECETGEMKVEGYASPQGTEKYVCDHCGHTATFP